MNISGDSFRVNNSINFAFEQSGVNNSPQSFARRDTYDDLQYSVDEISNSSILTDYKKDSQFKMQNIAGNGTNPLVIYNDEGKKRERKGIFEKHHPRNIGVVNNGTQQIEKKAGNGGREPEAVAMKRNQIFSKPKQQSRQIPASIQSNTNRMVPPPYLPRNVMPVAKHPNSETNQVNNNRISNNSVRSVVVNDYNSLILNESHNPYTQSRDSRQMSETYVADRFGSFQAADMKDISQIHQDLDLNASQSSNRSIRSTILDQIRINQIQDLNSKIKIQEGVMLSGIGIVESQKGNNLSLHPVMQENTEFVPIPDQRQTIIQSLSPKNSNIVNPQTLETNPNNRASYSFPSPNIVPQTHQILINIDDNLSNKSSLSMHSNIDDLKSSLNSSNLMNSDSLNRALGNLSQYVFEEPTIQSRIPQFLQECCRLNSISINLYSPNMHLNSIRHKQMIRNQIFESLMATQTLQKIRDQLQVRQSKQKGMLKSFNTNVFIQGEWYDLNKIKNTNIIRPKQAHTKRPVDYEKIKQILMNSLEVLKYYQDFIQHFRIESTHQFRNKYIQLRTSLFEIFNNLKKISEDLYMKSVHCHLPELYYKIYQYLKHSSGVKTSATNLNQLSRKIEDKEKLLVEIQKQKKLRDPLACSQLAAEVFNKIKEQITRLKNIAVSLKNESS